jgi:hypothetical protein
MKGEVSEALIRKNLNEQEESVKKELPGQVILYPEE